MKTTYKVMYHKRDKLGREFFRSKEFATKAEAVKEARRLESTTAYEIRVYKDEDESEPDTYDANGVLHPGKAIAHYTAIAY